jgi:hypothetical protein
MNSPLIFFSNFYIQFKQATPVQIDLYMLSLQMHKKYDPDHVELVHFANQIISTSRQTYFEILKTIKFKIGLNILSNKLYCLNNHIDSNLSFYAFNNKIKI